MKDLLKKQQQNKTRKNFFAERRNQGFNLKTIEKINNMLSILSKLIGEHGREGLRVSEIVKLTGLSKVTVINLLDELNEKMGVIDKKDAKYYATMETGRFSQKIREELGFGYFNIPRIQIFRNISQTKLNNMLTNQSTQLVIANPRWKKDGQIDYTGSIWRTS